MKTFTRCLVGVLALSLPLTAAAQLKPRPTAQSLKPTALAVSAKPAEEVQAPVVVPAAEPAPVRVSWLRGTVLNEQGQPLAGATVTLAADKTQTCITNAEGIYELRSAVPTTELRVSYAGYQDALFTANADRPVYFQLEPVADYGRQLKKQSKEAEKAYRKP